MAGKPELSFAGLLRQLRVEADLTQEELAEAASLSPRSVSDLERGINRTAHKDTAELLAGALGLAGPVRGLFVAAARGRAPAGDVLAALSGAGSGWAGCPYLGLVPFGERDAPVFYGRGELASQLARRLAGRPDSLPRERRVTSRTQPPAAATSTAGSTAAASAARAGPAVAMSSAAAATATAATASRVRRENGATFTTVHWTQPTAGRSSRGANA